MPSIFQDPELRELVAQFVAELAGRVEAIETAAERFDLGEVRRLAHQLKGAGGSYGFPAISEAAAEVEQAVREKTGIAQAIRRLREVIETV